MTNTVKHTPAPWYFGSFPETDDTADLHYDLHAGGSCIATISHLTNADASFMAQSVNAHDSLVEALQKIADGCDDAQDFAIAQLRNLGLGSVK